MRILHPVVLGAALLLWSGSRVLSAAPGATPPAAVPVPTATATAPAAPLDPYTQDLLNRLNSTNPAQREAAQKQLASIAGLMQTPEILTRLQDVTTDQELKDFFSQRITQLKAKEEEKRITNMPRMALNVSNASLTQLVSELNTALNAPIKFEGMNSGGSIRAFRGGAVVADGGPTWTLDVKDKPFWEIFVALQEQQPLDIQNYGNPAIRLSSGGIRGQRHYAIDGPAIVYATGINYQRSVSFPTPPNAGQPANLYVQLMTVADPRIRVTRMQQPTAVKAMDDEGRNLANPNQGGGYQNNQSNIFTWSLNLNPPERLAKTVTVSFDSSVTTTVGDTLVAINDLQKNANKPVTFANRTARITNLSGDATTNINMQLNVQPAGDTGGVDYNYSIPFSVSDSTGRTLYSSSISTGGTGIGFSTTNSQPPYKLEFRVPGRNVDIPVHFELKDLPLP
jgi:hypothetical protein